MAKSQGRFQKVQSKSAWDAVRTRRFASGLWHGAVVVDKKERGRKTKGTKEKRKKGKKGKRSKRPRGKRPGEPNLAD
jgi:hypothetical protein